MTTLLNFGRDVQGYNAEAPQFSTDIYTATLAASAAESFTVPSNFPVWVMVVTAQPNGWCWVSRVTTAAIPASGTPASATSELVTGTLAFKRTVYAGDVISFITPNMTCDIEIALFSNSYPTT